MPNGSNYALNHGAQLNSLVGVLKKNYCYKCANDMLANTLYRMFTRMAIKSL